MVHVESRNQLVAMAQARLARSCRVAAFVEVGRRVALSYSTVVEVLHRRIRQLDEELVADSEAR